MAPSSYCPPGSQPQRIASYLAEVLKLSPAELRAVGISLQATLSSASPGTDNYRVPSDQDLVVFSIEGYLRMPTLATEPASVGNSNVDHDTRVYVKTQNCLVAIENTDRSYKVYDNRDQSLAALTPPYGAPQYFPAEAPLLVPAGHNLRGTFTLQDTTVAVIGNASVYGVLLSGVLIPKQK